jgi:hypothetical protein
MEQSCSWESGSCLASQEIPRPSPRPNVTFRNMLIFYGETFLAIHPTPELEDHLLSDVHDCLFSIFTPTFHIWRFLPQPQPAMVTRDPVNIEIMV